MWLLSWIQDGKQKKILVKEDSDLVDYYLKLNQDIGFLIEKIPIFIRPDPRAPKKEPTYNRLVPLSDTTYKEEK
jgi:hypothetical protein